MNSDGKSMAESKTSQLKINKVESDVISPPSENDKGYFDSYNGFWHCPKVTRSFKNSDETSAIEAKPSQLNIINS